MKQISVKLGERASNKLEAYHKKYECSIRKLIELCILSSDLKLEGMEREGCEVIVSNYNETYVRPKPYVPMYEYEEELDENDEPVYCTKHSLWLSFAANCKLEKPEENWDEERLTWAWVIWEQMGFRKLEADDWATVCDDEHVRR